MRGTEGLGGLVRCNDVGFIGLGWHIFQFLTLLISSTIWIYEVCKDDKCRRNESC